MFSHGLGRFSPFATTSGNVRCLREVATRRLGFDPRGGGGGLIDGKGRRRPGEEIRPLTGGPAFRGHRAASGPRRLRDSDSRPDATPGPPLRPGWARASADQGGGEAGGPPGLRRLGCFPRPITGLPASVPTKPRVTTDRNERRIANGAELENEHRSVTARGCASPICNARERAGRGQFRLSRL